MEFLKHYGSVVQELSRRVLFGLAVTLVGGCSRVAGAQVDNAPAPAPVQTAEQQVRAALERRTNGEPAFLSIERLFRKHPREKAAVLIRSMDDPDPTVRLNSCKSVTFLSIQNPDFAAPFADVLIDRLLRGRTQSLKVLSATALEQVYTPAVRQAFIKAASDPEIARGSTIGILAMIVCEALSFRGGKDCINAVVPLLGNSNWHIRLHAARMLAMRHIPDRRVRAVLQDLSRDPRAKSDRGIIQRVLREAQKAGRLKPDYSPKPLKWTATSPGAAGPPVVMPGPPESSR